MSTHNLEYQPEERLITEISDLKRQVSELRTLQLQGTAAVNMAATAVYTATAVAVADGSATLATFTLTNTEQKSVFSTFHFTLWQGSPFSGGQIIGSASNILGFSYKWSHWKDENGTNFGTYGYRSVERIWVENHTGSPQDIWVTGFWLYIVNGGSAVVS